jgi:hypothetical protein
VPYDHVQRLLNVVLPGSTPETLALPLEHRFYATQFQVHHSVLVSKDGRNPFMSNKQEREDGSPSEASGKKVQTYSVLCRTDPLDTAPSWQQSGKSFGLEVASEGGDEHDEISRRNWRARQTRLVPIHWLKVSLQFDDGVLSCLVHHWVNDDFGETTTRWMTLARRAAAPCELDFCDCVAALFHNARVCEIAHDTSFVATATVEDPLRPDVVNVNVNVPDSPACRLRAAKLDASTVAGTALAAAMADHKSAKRDRMKKCRLAFLGALRNAQSQNAKIEDLVDMKRGHVVTEATRLCLRVMAQGRKEEEEASPSQASPPQASPPQANNEITWVQALS